MVRFLHARDGLGFVDLDDAVANDILASQSARDDYLGLFAENGITLAGINAHGNPPHPKPSIGPKHAEDLRRAILTADALGQTRVVTIGSAAHLGSLGTRARAIAATSWETVGTQTIAAAGPTAASGGGPSTPQKLPTLRIMSGHVR
jgi:sugar phosphate isomerase/epimerase